MKIFGTAASKAFRAMWMAEEAGIDYEQIPVHPKTAKTHPELLAINPAGKIPALLDGTFALTESLAITTYIAKKYAPAFLPHSIEDEARLIQWTLFASTEIEPPLIAYLHALGIPFGNVDEEEARKQRDPLQRTFSYMEQSFSTDYLIGQNFTVADLNVASVLIWAKIGKIDLTAYPKLNSWLSLCFKRKAYIKLRTKHEAERRNRNRSTTAKL